MTRFHKYPTGWLLMVLPVILVVVGIRSACASEQQSIAVDGAELEADSYLMPANDEDDSVTGDDSPAFSSIKKRSAEANPNSAQTDRDLSPVSSLFRRSPSLTKNFIRFGRSGLRSLTQSSLAEDNGQETDNDEDDEDLVESKRTGRLNSNFIRFGRKDYGMTDMDDGASFFPSYDPFSYRFRRFGRRDLSNNFLRFGR